MQGTQIQTQVLLLWLKTINRKRYTVHVSAFDKFLKKPLLSNNTSVEYALKNPQASLDQLSRILDIKHRLRNYPVFLSECGEHLLGEHSIYQIAHFRLLLGEAYLTVVPVPSYVYDGNWSLEQNPHQWRKTLNIKERSWYFRLHFPFKFFRNDVVVCIIEVLTLAAALSVCDCMQM